MLVGHTRAVKRPPPQTLAAIGVLAVLALVAVFTARREAAPAASFASTDYRAGGFRAWAALLEREGITTGRFVLRPIELTGRIDTLISAQPPPASTDANARTAADVAALAAWVRGGGRLVYVGRNGALGDAENGLLRLPFWLPEVGARGSLAGPAAAAVRTLHELGTNRMLFVEHPGTSELADTNGDIVVRYPLGRGEVVAVSDAVPFANANIAGADNARLAFLLGQPRRTGGLVAFDDGIHGALIDRPWYRALPLPVRVSLGIAGVALLLALAGGALPGIPPLRLEPPREPTSAEFVAALAALYERTGARTAARATLVRDALATASRSGGLDGDLSPAGIAGAFAERPGGDDVRRLVAALDGPISTDPELLAYAKLAHTVRKECSHDGNGDGRRAAFASWTRTRRRW